MVTLSKGLSVGADLLQVCGPVAAARYVAHGNPRAELFMGNGCGLARGWRRGCNSDIESAEASQ